MTGISPELPFPVHQGNVLNVLETAIQHDHNGTLFILADRLTGDWFVSVFYW